MCYNEIQKETGTGGHIPRISRTMEGGMIYGDPEFYAP